jgi:hypothetical protein
MPTLLRIQQLFALQFALQFASQLALQMAFQLWMHTTHPFQTVPGGEIE